jgi:hypothetical protein
MPLTEDEAAKILLVRSVEESDRNALPKDILADAVKQAAANVQGTAWFVRRASFLFGNLSPGYRSIIHLAELPDSWLFPICVLCLILGFGTNLLGPADKIHVIRNPVLYLVIWNLLVYIALLFVYFHKKTMRFDRGLGQKAWNKASSSESPGIIGERSEKQPNVSWFLKWLLPGAWELGHRLFSLYGRMTTFNDVVWRFWGYWLTAAGPVIVARWKRMLYCGAPSLAVGATVGMYFRGLFQGYEVVWGSTFIRSEEAVSTWINVVFSPAFLVAQIVGWNLRGEVNLTALLSPEGDPAGPWIHLFMITVALVVVLPRAALAAWQSARIRNLSRSLPLLFDRYYAEVIESPIRSLVEEEIRKEVGKFAQSVASYVRQEFYDNQIVPKLAGFRENGGKIADLRSQIKDATEAFAPQVKTFISDRAAPEFQRLATVAIERIIRVMGVDFFGINEPAERLVEIKVETPGASVDAIGYGYGDTISAAIAVSIALALGTISGGFGAELEIAILTVLLGTTGPIGFVIGALIGILIAGAGWWFGKEKITEFVESIDLPATLVRTTLWDSRYQTLVEDGRKQCEESIRAKVAEEMERMVPQITEGVLFRVRRLWEV